MEDGLLEHNGALQELKSRSSAYYCIGGGNSSGRGEHDRLFGLRIGASRIGEEFCSCVEGENTVWKLWVCVTSAEKQVECCNDKHITRTSRQRDR